MGPNKEKKSLESLKVGENNLARPAQNPVGFKGVK